MGERADAGAAPTLVAVEFFQQFEKAVVAGVEMPGQGGDFPGQLLPLFEPGLWIGVLQAGIVSVASGSGNQTWWGSGPVPCRCWINTS